MRRLAICACVAAMLAAPAFARSDKGAAEQITCKDGTTQTVENTRGACSGHGGIDKRDTKSMGSGAAKVWANDDSKVYHCSGDRYYGKTKHGEYMSEAEAKDKGFRPDHGKACKS